MNEIVKYHKDFENKLVLKNFTASELNFLMSICTKVRGKKGDEVIFTFNELKELSKWTKKDEKDFIKSLKDTNKKLMALNFEIPNEEAEAGGGTQFVLFPLFDVLPKSKILKVSVNTSFTYLLNNLSNNFNWYQLNVFTSFKSKYAKLLYKELMLFKDTGYRIFKIEEFRKKLDIPEKYRMTNIQQKVLKPIEEDFRNILKDFEIVKIKSGRNITQIRFNFTYSNINQVEIEDNKNIDPAGELEQYFKTTFPDVNYTVKHRKVLENLLKNNSLEYIKQYLKDQWEYTQNNNNIKNKPAYFSKLILEEKSVLKDYLPADYEEKKAEENNRNTKGITSLKELVKDITDRKNITPEQIEQQVLLKADITEEKYNKIKQDWIDKEKETNTLPLGTLEKLFDMKNKEKYNIIPAEKEETKLNLKYTKEVYEGKIKKTEYQIEFYKKELFKIMEDDDLELEELEEKRKYIEDKIENYKIKIENYKKEILKLKEEKIKK